MDYQVACYSGWKYGEHPTAIISDEGRDEISEILKRWRTPEGLFFQVWTKNGISFELVYDESRDRWKVSAI
jgi:hypothetical protein